MSTVARRRLLNDYKKFEKEATGLGKSTSILISVGILIKPNENDMMVCEALIFGPDDTEWEGGVFRLLMVFPEKFPNEPPTVKFLTTMFHPNIYANGDICLDILGKSWSPLYDCNSVLTSIQQLLSDPNPDSPANNEAA